MLEDIIALTGKPDVPFSIDYDVDSAQIPFKDWLTDGPILRICRRI